jgi:tripartite-type tricarboxylate transporter receptor subunit TctC
MFPGLAAALPHIRSGRIRALAVTGATRHPLMENVPTMIEAGFTGFDATQWYGVVAPAGLAAPVLRTLNDTLNATLAQAALHERLSGEAVQTMPMAPDAFARYIREDIARWTRLARERKIELDS